MQYTLRQIAGVLLWWAEGTKARKDKRWKNTWMYHVDFTNTNQEMVQLFLDFLRKDIGVDEKRLKLQLQIHEGDDQKLLEKHWSVLTKIPFNRFYKTIIRPKGLKVGKTNGTCKIRYCDKATYLRLNELLQDTLKLVAKNKQKW